MNVVPKVSIFANILLLERIQKIKELKWESEQVKEKED